MRKTLHGEAQHEFSVVSLDVRTKDKTVKKERKKSDWNNIDLDLSVFWVYHPTEFLDVLIFNCFHQTFITTVPKKKNENQIWAYFGG